MFEVVSLRNIHTLEGVRFVLEMVKPITPFGYNFLRGILPFSNEELLSKELHLLSQFVLICNEQKKSVDEIFVLMQHFKDIHGSLSHGRTLSEVELFEIKVFLVIYEQLLEVWYRLESEYSLAEIKLVPLTEPLNIVDPTKERGMSFYISADFNSALTDIRARKNAIENAQGFCAAENMEWLSLAAKEEEEELYARKHITLSLKRYFSEMIEVIEKLARIDLLFQKALLAISFNCVRPEFSENGGLMVSEMTNPHIDSILTKDGRKFVPVCVELKGGVTVITGANMGGKSVVLQTLFLNIALFKLGFYVFCQKAQLPFVEEAFLISGDNSAAKSGLSEFGGQVMALNSVIKAVQEKSCFVAIDELAGGTNPREGAALVLAAAKFFNSMKSVTVITTHFDVAFDIDISRYQVVGLKNSSANLVVHTESPLHAIAKAMDYRLERVDNNAMPPKDALNICKMLGLDNTLLSMFENISAHYIAIPVFNDIGRGKPNA